MFRKLRNKLIWINLGVTTIVILTAFTAIYMFATGSAQNRPSMPEQQMMVFSEGFEDTINVTIRRERQAAANDLLLTLIVSGIAIELIVAGVSFYLAEESIKPVREAYEAQKVFIANASHEIKTPLAAIAANLEAADIHGNKWLRNVELETEKLTALNNQLLILARTDLMEKSTLDEVELKNIAAEVIESFESRLSKVEFTSKLSARGKVRLSEADFKQILSILLDNAIKYSDKKIRLKLTNNELMVANDGTVIAENDLPHVFERFYQADKSSDGVGLGLSIAKSIAMRNGWDLSVSADNKMTCFVLKFA